MKTDIQIGDNVNAHINRGVSHYEVRGILEGLDSKNLYITGTYAYKTEGLQWVNPREIPQVIEVPRHNISLLVKEDSSQ